MKCQYHANKRRERQLRQAIRRPGMSMRFSLGPLLIRFVLALVFALQLPALGASAPLAPPGRIPFQSYGTMQGLKNLSIWCLDQDADGFLWVGTEDGLFRYDGSTFQSFGTGSGLQNAWVRSLCVGRKDRLWIGTTRGLALREHGRIRPLQEPEGLPRAEVFALALDGEARLWVATDRGLFRERAGALAFDEVPGWPAQGLARSLWVDGRSVYVTNQARLIRYDLDHPKDLVVVPGPWKERLDAVLKDGQGRLWVRSRSGLWMQPEPQAPFQDLSSKVGVSSYDGALRMTPGGTLLIPVVDGLMRVHDQAWEMLREPQGMPTPYVNRAMVDREGSLWLGGLGLHRSLSREAWMQYTFRDGIVGGVVRSIVKDLKGRMWVGTTRGLSMGHWDVWKPVPETLQQAILAIAVAPDGALWLGGAPGRLRRWVPEKDLWQEFPQPESTITSLCFDQEGTLWVASRRQGLFRVLAEGSSYRVEPFTPPGTNSFTRFQSMATGRDGRLWLVSTDGLLLKQHGQWRCLGKAQGLKSTHLVAVFERPNGEVWVSYEDVQGISRFALEGDRLVLLDHLDAAKGFVPQLVEFIREDALGQVWVGTSQGVAFREGARFQLFGVADGLPGEDCNGSAFLAEPEGGVWVGTLGGMAHFRPTHFEGLPKAPSTFILWAQYGTTKVDAALPGSLELPGRDATIEFRFTGLTYLNETKVVHQVRLLGLEDAWRVSETRQARYTNLGPGAYRFEARAGYGDGTWGPVAVFTFRVLPSWYQTWWFRTLVGLSLAGIGILLVKGRLKVLEARNRDLEGQVATRTRALADANEILRQLTVTDPLTGLKNRRFLDLTIQDDLAKVHRDYQTLARGQAQRMVVNVDMVFLMVDLDHFKDVNDTYGHAVGDVLLQQIRDRLLEAVRNSDTVVRWGGEEFLVVTRYTDRAQGAIVAERILDLIRSRPYDLGNGVQITKTCSLGFCPYPMMMDHPDALTWHQIVAIADHCLYAAKLSGRDGWVGMSGVFDQPPQVDAFLKGLETWDWPETSKILTSFPDPAKLRWQ